MLLVEAVINPKALRATLDEHACTPISSQVRSGTELTSENLMKPKVLLGTYGSDTLAAAALEEARKGNYTLVAICLCLPAARWKY